MAHYMLKFTQKWIKGKKVNNCPEKSFTPTKLFQRSFTPPLNCSERSPPPLKKYPPPRQINIGCSLIGKVVSIIFGGLCYTSKLNINDKARIGTWYVQAILQHSEIWVLRFWNDVNPPPFLAPTGELIELLCHRKERERKKGKGCSQQK